MDKSVAILVLACASPPYDRMLQAIRSTWGKHPTEGMDLYYLYGNPASGVPADELSRYLPGDLPVVPDDRICQIGDVLIAGCGDSMHEQKDCLLRKRLLAFDYLTDACDYDLVYTVCATSYVVTDELSRFIGAMPQPPAVAGAVSINQGATTPFVSGASMLLTADVARELGSHRKEIIDGNRYDFRDDVTIGHWVATRMSSIPLSTFIEDVTLIRPLRREHTFLNVPDTTVDFVTLPSEDQRPVAGAYHYHFHSHKPHDMERFHTRVSGPGR